MEMYGIIIRDFEETERRINSLRYWRRYYGRWCENYI
jgi:hypothetical protein